jgi:hypothetical protein
MNDAMNTPAPIRTVTESRALTLLGSGIAPHTVAASLGISPARISQLLSDENFAAQVAELRYKNLAQHNERDSAYDSVEDTLLERLKDCLPLMHRPMEIIKAIQVINGAKRRGASTPEAIVEKQSIVQLVVPVQIINKFQTNLQGQVITVGSDGNEQNLLTIQSGALEGLAKGKRDVNANAIESDRERIGSGAG